MDTESKTMTTKDAEALAKELTSDIYNPPMLHGGFDDAPEVDWPTLNETVKTKIQSALTAAEQRGKADAAPDGWQPIETAPRMGKILLWYPCYTNPQIGWWNVPGNKFENGGELFCKDKIYIAPTHWRPLPAAPSPANSKTEGK